METLNRIPQHIRKYGGLGLLGLILIGAVVVLIQAKRPGNGLTASGTIEAVQVNIAAQLNSQVLEVLAEEGDQVQAGDLLLRLDQAQILAQINQASAALRQAQAAHDLLVSGGSPESRAARITAAEYQLLLAEQNLETLYDAAARTSAEAQQALAQARDRLDRAQTNWLNNQPGNRASIEELKSARAKVVLAEEQVAKKQKLYDSAGDRIARAKAQIALTEAIDNYQSAVWYLNWLQDGADEIEMALLDADVALAQAGFSAAEDAYEEVKAGPDPDALALSEAALANAQAQLALARSDPSQAELAASQAQVDAAQAALEFYQVQLARTEITAPCSGTILYRMIEPGELAVAGSPVLTLVQLEGLSLTVYLAEDEYGRVSLGDQVQVRVDSFPEQIFSAEVIRIADQAEFTPRNVQTQEGRRTSVFGIELRIVDPGRLLKPGMPADVEFTT